MVQAISNLAVGSKIKDPDSAVIWRIIEKNGSAFTLFADDSINLHTTFGSSFYSGGPIDVAFDTFYNSLPAKLKAKVNYTPILSYTSDTSMSTIYRFVYALSRDELRGNVYGEGTYIPYFDTTGARIATESYWTRTKVLNASDACYIQGNNGEIYGSPMGTSFALRPAMKISTDNVMVSDTATSGVYTIVWNVTPTISGSDTNVGQKNAPFTYAYTVNDTNSTDNLTITEKANSITIRTITNAVRGQTYTADLTSVWKQMPINTATTLTITVSDGALTATRTITFTRFDDRVVACFKQASLTPESVQPEQVLVRVIRTIATNADFKVFVCSNGLDTSPTWEDATSAVLAGTEYTFTNRMKTADNYAVNVKIQVLKNTASAYSYIKALGFSYI